MPKWHSSYANCHSTCIALHISSKCPKMSHWNRYFAGIHLNCAMCICICICIGSERIKKKYEQNVLIYWFKLHCSNTFIIYIFNVCIVSCDEHIYLYFRNIGKLFSCLPMLIFSLCVCCFSFSFSICVLLLLVSLCNKTLDDTVVHTMNHCVTLYSHTHKQNWRCIRGNVEMCGTIEIC